MKNISMHTVYNSSIEEEVTQLDIRSTEVFMEGMIPEKCCKE